MAGAPDTWKFWEGRFQLRVGRGRAWGVQRADPISFLLVRVTSKLSDLRELN